MGISACTGEEILEWSPTPEEGFSTALYLNNRYQWITGWIRTGMPGLPGVSGGITGPGKNVRSSG